MEYKKIKIKKQNFDQTIKDYISFKWTIVSKTEKDNHFIVALQREENIPNYFKVVSLEEKFNEYNAPNMLLVVILIGIAFCLLTAFLLFGFVIKIDFLVAFFAFLLPGLAIFIVGSVISILKTNKINKIINDGGKTQNEIRKELTNL